MSSEKSPSPQASLPLVTESLVATPLPDGYWAQTFPFSSSEDTYPDLIAYGLGFKGSRSTVRLFINPLNESRHSGWSVSEIASLDFPVGMTVADLTGDGFNDVIVCDRYGPSMSELWDAETQSGGRVIWLKNPGVRARQPLWELKEIGNSTGMHRLQAGHFTRTDVVQIMGLPIIAKSGDFDSPAPVIVFTPTYLHSGDHSSGPCGWASSIAFPSQFRLIHDVALLPRSNGDLDMVLVSGNEGIVVLWFDQTWRFVVVNPGLSVLPTPQPSGHIFRGSGSVAVCRVDDDDVGYIVSCDAFHGYEVAVYVKSKSAPKGPLSLRSTTWTRKVIDNFGPLDPDSQTGPLHHVVAVPLVDRATAAFAIACMGVRSGDASKQGVYLYKPIDLTQAKFEKIKITGESAGRLAIANFSSLWRTEIASISYYVPGYFTGPDPPQLRINTVGAETDMFFAAKLNKEILLRIPRPTSVDPQKIPTLPLWSLAGKTLAIRILCPKGKVILDASVIAIKVTYGEVDIEALNSPGSSVFRSIAPSAKCIDSTSVPPCAVITARESGAVFITVMRAKGSLQGPFTTMEEISSKSAMPETSTIPPEVANSVFPFIRVDQLPWGSSGLWNNFSFYNAVGFHVYFNDDFMDKVVHIQAWTLGIGETARFHVHSDTGRSFCEIHYCLNNGGGKAGMRYFDDDSTWSGEEIKKQELSKEFVEKNTTLLVVPDLHEHGPLWKIQPGTDAQPDLLPNGAVDYPYHAWLASRFGEHALPIQPPLAQKEQSFDVWLAFEFPSSAFQPGASPSHVVAC